MMIARKTLISLFCFCMLVSIRLTAQVLMPTGNSSSNKQLLNGKWKFKYIPSHNAGSDSLFYKNEFDTKNWGDIITPGNWELQGFAEPVYGQKVKEGTGLYKTQFDLPSSWKGNPVYIAFDGVSFGYTFWVNGSLAGEFASSYNRQTFDISPFVQLGKKNTLAVKVITHPKGWEFDTNDDWALSGITRDVTLFSLPQVHIKDVVVKTFVQPNDTCINILASVEKILAKGNVQVMATLSDPAGKQVKITALAFDKSKTSEDAIHFTGKINLTKALLWTQEKPSLYTLHLSLQQDGKELQQYTSRVGIRELSWAGGVFKLNGVPIKLRGATHHDLSPVTGRAINEAEMIRDIRMMQLGNMNFLRTSHYPPNEKLLDLCDSMGMYVMDEVPYGFGDEHLTDTSYLPLLLERARLTLWRDKNHPSVIIWSVGNENPVTPIGLITGRYVKTTDNTRPYTFPQTPGEFEKMLKALPDSLDMLDDHYALTTDLRRYTSFIEKPLVLSEYSHALGLDDNNVDSMWEAMLSHPKLAGGAVWEFFDQGILRKSPKKAVIGEPTFFAWSSADSIYDTGGNGGTDGIVYANRVPQVDYWQIRKVYSPVKALDATIAYKPGKQSLSLTFVNRYDFTNLSEIKCTWQLFADTSVVDSGTLPLACKAHDSMTTKIDVNFPSISSALYYRLKLICKDKNGYQLYEKIYPVQYKNGRTLLEHLYTKPANVYKFELAGDKKTVSLKNKAGDIVIEKGFFTRVGRKPTMSQDATLTSRRSQAKHTIWSPYILANSDAEITTSNEKEMIMHYTAVPDSAKLGVIAADIVCHFSDSGYISVQYSLKPKGKGEAVETGVSFLIPASLSEFRWIGKGPYEAYPGKDKLSEFGFFHLNSNDLYYAGNRQDVSCAIFSDKKGNGFALIADKANISVERTSEGLVVSHKGFVASRFNKYTWPDELYSLANGKTIEGNFFIVPLTTGAWPDQLKKLFGNSNSTVVPYQPFFYSYDQ